MCPGNNESAGKRKTGTTPTGNRWLRRGLDTGSFEACDTFKAADL